MNDGSTEVLFACSSLLSPASDKSAGTANRECFPGDAQSRLGLRAVFLGPMPRFWASVILNELFVQAQHRSRANVQSRCETMGPAIRVEDDAEGSKQLEEGCEVKQGCQGHRR